MADQQPLEGSSLSDVSGGSSLSALELNIKTLDSRIFSFQADKNMAVSSFKEKIASQIGVPIGQQRLIFRGKVLKDDHALSEYNVENGDTLHLVERQPQPSPGSVTEEAVASNDNRGSSLLYCSYIFMLYNVFLGYCQMLFKNFYRFVLVSGQEHPTGGPRNRIGQITHSVVLGTLNVGEPGSGEAGVPDLSRVIGAVLNSIGIGNLAGGIQPGMQASYGNETEGSQVNAGSQSQAGNQSVPMQSPGQSAPHAMQIPLGTAINIPSLNMPIPDSLNTLSEFMSRMEQAFTQNGYQPNQSPNVSSDPPTAELPSNSRGPPTPAALSIVLQHAQRLLSGPTISALSHIAGRLDQEGGSTDTTVRGQIQSESVQLGIAMQHLGALLLELGRTILTLHMGQSPAEYFLNSGPAVYISPSGPNPIMVQPFPLQSSSLFGGPAGFPSNPVAPGPVGIGSVPRNVNIHIHTGASLAPIVSNLRSRAPNGEGMQGEHVNGMTSGDSGQSQVLSGRNFIATSRPSVVSVSGAVGGGVSQAPDSGSFNNVIAEINSELRRFVANAGNENHAPSGQSEDSTGGEQSAGSGTRNDDTGSQQLNSSSNGDEETSTSSVPSTIGNQKTEPQCRQPCNTEDMGGVVNLKSEPSNSFAGGSHNWSNKSDLAIEGSTRSNQGKDISDGSSSGVPIGLGLGGLHPKRRSRLQRAQSKNSDDATASNRIEQSRAVGQQVLQSLASFSTRENVNTPPLGQSQDSQQPPRGVMSSTPMAGQNVEGQDDVASSMSHILQSPALDGLLAGVSQQTGVGSPDMLRNMLQQFTQNPAMRSTVNQLAQQIDSNNLGSMFSGFNRGQGGGIDLSAMMQQMMPIVSQALGGGSSVAQPNPPLESGMFHSRSGSDMSPSEEDSKQTELRQVVQRLETQNSAGEIFRSVVESAVHQYGHGSADLVNELCSEGRLAHEFMQMLSHDISQRLQDETGS
ncbi:large proline-rich BAG6-like isoform X1 [Olea europaea subsp. europaea]|uniref:Large proline-rich BAG6-like isoform X1 n=2 Tax=Olea europaea subsp. europaea TaxID=158383 RepID=A0A8S0VK86_OLEEU|nr:large proline-rich BAG6-like isoform X1 [Olea europaea subsp. europaea]